MTERTDRHRENAYEADGNLQALLRRRASWLTEADAERLASFGAWVATEVETQADYTNPRNHVLQ